MTEDQSRSEHPFDAIAAQYDDAFTGTLLGRWLRALVWEQLDKVFQPGDCVLELGCGTGEDACRLAERGVHVLATDAAAGMLEAARHKARSRNLMDRISFAQLDLTTLGQAEAQPPSGPSGRGHLDGAFSSFGALNCISDQGPLAAALARWVRPGGQVILVVMGPFCAWEALWHLAHGRPGAVFRRRRSGAPAHIGGGRTCAVWYPSPRALQRTFAPHFRTVKTIALGAMLPPSYLNHLVARWPRAFQHLARLERRWHEHFPWPWISDHYIVHMERK